MLIFDAIRHYAEIRHFDTITLMRGIKNWLLIPSCFIFSQVGEPDLVQVAE